MAESHNKVTRPFEVPIVKEPEPESEDVVDGISLSVPEHHHHPASLPSLSSKSPDGSNSGTPSGSPGSGSSSTDMLDLNNVEVIDDLNVNRWLMRIMRLGATYTSTGSNGYGRTSSISSGSSSSRSGRRLSMTTDISASNLLRPPNTSRGRRFSDSINFGPAGLGAGPSPGLNSGVTSSNISPSSYQSQNPFVRLQRPMRKGKKSGN